MTKLILDPAVKGVFITPELFAEIREAVWRHRGTVAHLWRENIAEVIADPTVLGDWGDVPDSGKRAVHVKVPYGMWMDLTVAAESEGLTISQAARLALRRILDTAPISDPSSTASQTTTKGTP